MGEGVSVCGKRKEFEGKPHNWKLNLRIAKKINAIKDLKI